MSEKNIPLSPVIETTIGPVVALNLMVIRFKFLVQENNGPERIQTGETYALSATQARQLIEQAARALQILESAAQKSPQSEAH
jgi:hypothetical protein